MCAKLAFILLSLVAGKMLQQLKEAGGRREGEWQIEPVALVRRSPMSVGNTPPLCPHQKVRKPSEGPRHKGCHVKSALRASGVKPDFRDFSRFVAQEWSPALAPVQAFQKLCWAWRFSVGREGYTESVFAFSFALSKPALPLV